VPDARLTTLFGNRKVMWDSKISVGLVRYSVPCGLIDERVSVQFAGVEPHDDRVFRTADRFTFDAILKADMRDPETGHAGRVHCDRRTDAWRSDPGLPGRRLTAACCPGGWSAAADFHAGTAHCGQVTCGLW
jgi:hypothetical protein